MEKDEFKYIAFISYRHNDLDKFVAENLHRLIETYKMPLPVAQKYNITDNNFRRVFRDQEELPLSSNLEDPIIDALKKSQFLIVICSPRLKESKWCKKEIESFIKFHGRNRILCVLVEGEPKESFPEILEYYEEEFITKTGSKRIKKIPCEPLAMDVRGNDKKEILSNLKKELIRVIAPMYNLDYDDIKRRHEERETKKKIRLFKIIAIVSFLFTLYSAFLFFKIYTSSEKLKYDQSINLANKSSELLAKDNRNEAILKAYQSVTKYDNISMPVTTEGIYELTESLGVYYLNKRIYPVSQLDTSGIVENMKANNDKKYLLSYDSSRELVLWDLDKENRVITIKDAKKTTSECSYTFIGNDKFAYINDNKEVVVLDIKGKEITRITIAHSPYNVSASVNGKYLEIDDNLNIYIYETNNYTIVSSFEVASDMKIVDNRYFDLKEENFVYALAKQKTLYSDSIKLINYNINKKISTSNITIPSDTLKEIIFVEDNALVLSKKRIELNTQMILTKYNYKTGKVAFQKVYNKEYATDMEVNFNNKNNKTILLIGETLAYLLDYNTGKQKRQYSISDPIVSVLQITDGSYATLSTNGYFSHIVTDNNKFNDADNNTRYTDLFNCHLEGYEVFLKTWAGYLAYTYNSNRIIIYNTLKNADIKEIKYEEKKFDKLSVSKATSLAEEYNYKKKDLVANGFYSDDNSLFFIVYTDYMLEIYNTETKELLKEVEIPKYGSFLSTYVGKTNNNQYIIKGIGGYILNEDFDLVAYVPNLYDYADGKLIMLYGDEYYEVKIYNEKEIINKGKEYLESKQLINNK